MPTWRAARNERKYAAILAEDFEAKHTRKLVLVNKSVASIRRDTRTAAEIAKAANRALHPES